VKALEESAAKRREPHEALLDAGGGGFRRVHLGAKTTSGGEELPQEELVLFHEGGEVCGGSDLL
jgi:hypothetical protein